MATPLINVMVDGERLEAGLLDRLSRLEVWETDNDPSIATFRLGLSQRPTGDFLPLDDGLFEPGVRIAIELGAPGSLPTRLFDGFATHLRPHFEEIEANCYAEIIATDMAAILDAEERVASYPDVSDSEAAGLILDRYGLELHADDTAARQTEAGQLLVQRGTDWSFLRRLAARNGFVCYFEYDPTEDAVAAHFKPPQLREPPQADLSILRENNNLRWIDFQFAMATPVRAVGAAIDPINKRLVRTDGAPGLEVLGDAPLADAVEEGVRRAGGTAAQVLLRDPFPTDAAINAHGTGATDLARFVLEARGELDPALYRGLLRARRPVLVKGVGARLSGTYYVRSVRTVLEEGRLSQSFVAWRNALGQSGVEDFGQSAEEVPPE